MSLKIFLSLDEIQYHGGHSAFAFHIKIHYMDFIKDTITPYNLKDEFQIMLVRPPLDTPPKKPLRMIAIIFVILICFLIGGVAMLYVVDFAPQSEQRTIPVDLNIS